MDGVPGLGPVLLQIVEVRLCLSTRPGARRERPHVPRPSVVAQGKQLVLAELPTRTPRQPGGNIGGLSSRDASSVGLCLAVHSVAPSLRAVTIRRGLSWPRTEGELYGCPKA